MLCYHTLCDYTAYFFLTTCASERSSQKSFYRNFFDYTIIKKIARKPKFSGGAPKGATFLFFTVLNSFRVLFLYVIIHRKHRFDILFTDMSVNVVLGALIYNR